MRDDYAYGESCNHLVAGTGTENKFDPKMLF